MPDRDPALEALRGAIEEFAAERAPELFAEASAEATARVRNLLAEAIAQELIERTAQLAGKPAPRPARSKPARRDTATRRAEPPTRTRAEPRDAEPRQPEPAREAAESACYVYGVIAAEAAATQSPTPGVDSGTPTRTIEHGELAAIVSDVSLESFNEEALEENLNDVGWLEQTARAHERVLDDALAGTTVVPMRLCTIYLGDDEVRSMLEREREALLEALGRLEGKTEWGVKMIAAPGALSRAHESAEARESGSSLSPGLAYLDAKRSAAKNEEELDLLAERWAAEVHDRLAQVASEALLNPLQSPELGGYEGDMLLNGVYLVNDRDEAEFRRLASELAADWENRDVAVELTGPWPPYNFVKNSIEAAR